MKTLDIGECGEFFFKLGVGLPNKSLFVGSLEHEWILPTLLGILDNWDLFSLTF